MSAWIVAKGHIDVLVNALFEYGVVEPSTDGRALGQELWHENHLSVNYRYRQDAPTPTTEYTLRTTEAPLHPDAIIEAVACFQYQSCEHPSWKESRSKELTNTLLAAVQERGGRYPQRFEWPWGFDSLDQAIKPEVPR